MSSNQRRVELFKKAYPDMEDVEDKYILRMLDKDKQVKRCLDLKLKEKIGQISFDESYC